MGAVGKTCLDDFALIFTAGEENGEGCSGAGILGCCIDADTIRKDNVSLAIGSGGQRHCLPLHVREICTHIVHHPAAFIGHRHQLLADGFTAPACTDIRGCNQRATFLHAGDEVGSFNHLRRVDHCGCEILTGIRTTGAKGERGKTRPVGTLAKAGIGALGSNGVCGCFQVIPRPIGCGFVDACICKSLRKINQAECSPVFRQGIGFPVEGEDRQQRGDKVVAADTGLGHILIKGQQLPGRTKGCH